jgi:hypothetical protein
MMCDVEFQFADGTIEIRRMDDECVRNRDVIITARSERPEDGNCRMVHRPMAIGDTRPVFMEEA